MTPGSHHTKASPVWAVAVDRLGSATTLERGRHVRDCLKALGHAAILVEDGDPAGLRADVLLFMENVADFGCYRLHFATRPAERPVTAVWMLETLPPDCLDAETERIGCRAAQWNERLGLVRPKSRDSAWRRRVTLRGFRQWLYKFVSGFGFRRVRRRLIERDATLIDDGWKQFRGAMLNWHVLRQARSAGWLDHCLVSTQQRQRFLADRGWRAPFVPVGWHPANGRLLDLKRDIDVLFLGYLRNDRRRRHLDRLERELAERGIALTRVTGGCFGEDRVQLLNRTRTVLMLHQYSWSPAWIRFMFAGSCGACVVSEPIADNQPFRRDVHRVEAPVAEMPAVIGALLADEARRSAIALEAHRFCQTRLTMENSVREIVAHVNRSPAQTGC